MTCPSCGSATTAEMKFCGNCGTRLSPGCPSCGAENPPGMKFCGQCGTPLAPGLPTGTASSPWVAQTSIGPAAVGEPAPFRAPEPLTERRVVSILFADLVGFTARSDGTDPEQVREFLAGYFELAREVVERYGGTIEKFIGDAVMAIWGAPVAQGDDAERAVRAALDLVGSVRHLAASGASADLQLRAAVLTGEAAVAIGAVGQGMVAGDLVNTASRLQSVAPPGSVLVGEATRRAADEAIAFEEAGEQVLKGKEAPVPAWRALRVLGRRGGGGRADGIEAPFVGRDDELRILRDVLHATTRERRIRLVSVTGQGGIGKSRLSWELIKYIDGLTETFYWHQGRSPAFGEGITFWALGEMVRRRAGLAEGDDEATSRARMASTLEEYVPEEAERRRIEPALLFLLGIGDAPVGGREELFAAWRVFIEQVSLRGTAVLLFEDLQWADAGLLDFIDHLLAWSIGYPILIVTLARPELLDRRPGWGAGRRDLVAMSLGPLTDDAMRDLLAGLVPGLPPSAVRTILDRADGVPLYAVETVRMLVDEGRLEEADGVYRIVGELGTLSVPERLASLIAARLDAVDPTDRALLQDGAVLGQTFSVAALAALSGELTGDLEPRLRNLVQREMLALDTDPRSPERGQYGFTQALIREVAYSTLAKRDRRAKHLAAARHFEALGDDETAGVLATHYVDAYEAAPEGPEGEAVAAQARIALLAAADRATALGAHDSAIGYWQRVLRVTSDAREEADVLLKIGEASRFAGHFTAAEASHRSAFERYSAIGDRLGVAQATIGIGRSLNASGRGVEAMALFEATEREVADLAPHRTVAELWVILAGMCQVIGRLDESIAYCDKALTDAESLRLTDVVADALRQKGGTYLFMGRVIEARALIEAVERLADRAGLGMLAARAAFSLALAQMEDDPRTSIETSRRAIEAARRFGLGPMRLDAIGNAIEVALQVGGWAWLEEELARIDPESLEPAPRATAEMARAEAASTHGADTSSSLVVLDAFVDGLEDPSMQAAVTLARAYVALGEGRDEVALQAASAAEDDDLNGPSASLVAGRAAVRLGDDDRAVASLARLIGARLRGEATLIHRDALAACISARQGRWSEAVAGFSEAWRRYRDLGMDVSFANSVIDAVVVAPPGDPFVQAAVPEARSILTREGATAYLARLDTIVADRSRSDAVAKRASDIADSQAASLLPS